MASLDLTTETECEDPKIAGIRVPVEFGMNSDEWSCQKSEENIHQTDDYF